MSDPASAQPTADLRYLVLGYRVTQLLYTAARLRLAETLAAGPKSTEELAATTGAHADTLYRVLRALASMGIFAETSPQRFVLTPLAEPLRADHPDSVWAFVMSQGAEVYRAWGDFTHSVTTGTPAFNHVFGMSHFDYLARHPEESAIFDRNMSEGARRSTPAIVSAYDFPASGTVVDVGGGQGLFLAAVLADYPALRGILFDQGHVVAGAKPILEAADVARRCDCASGDFFAAVPAGGNVYLLRRILHDWDDERCLTILRNCARAMASDGKILVVETLVTADREATQTTLLDLHMLVMTGGRERTAAEYRDLFTASGLRLIRILPTGSAISILEAERASPA